MYLIRGVTQCILVGGYQLLEAQKAFNFKLFSNLNERKQYETFELLAVFKKVHAFLLISVQTNAHNKIFYIKTFKIAPTCFDPKIIFRELHCSSLKSLFLKTLAD